MIEIGFGALSGEQALDELRALRDGRFELVQRLPSIEDAIRGKEELSCSLQSTPLPDIIRQCESKALSCAISVERDGKRLELTYRAGELAHIDGAGGDTSVDLHAIEASSAHIQALPLKQRIRRPEPALAPRSKRSSSPPPVPGIFDVPAPLPQAHHSLMRRSPHDQTPSHPAMHPVASGEIYPNQLAQQALPPRQPTHPEPTPAPAPLAHGYVRPDTTGTGTGWRDPTWVQKSRNINWAYAGPNAGPTSRIPIGNAALGIGLICLTLLVGVVASHL